LGQGEGEARRGRGLARLVREEGELGGGSFTGHVLCMWKR